MLNKIDIWLQPPSSTSSTSGGLAGKSAGKGASWLREMERQEVASWLGHGPLPPGKREQTLFRQATQSVIASEASAQGLRLENESTSADEVPGASAVNGQEVSPTGAIAGMSGDPRARCNAAENVAPARLPQPAPGCERDTVAKDGLAQPAPARGVPAAGLAQYVMGQLNRESGNRIVLQTVPLSVTGAQPGPEDRLAMAPAALRPVAAFDPVGSNAGVGQQRAIAALPDEKEEVAVQHSARSALPHDGEETPAVRVHTFWSGQSVRVWVGTDNCAALDAQQLALAAQDLRRLLREQGATLGSLTVNGETVAEQDERLAKPKEAPAPARGSTTQA